MSVVIYCVNVLVLKLKEKKKVRDMIYWRMIIILGLLLDFDKVGGSLFV